MGKVSTGMDEDDIPDAVLDGCEVEPTSLHNDTRPLHRMFHQRPSRRNRTAQKPEADPIDEELDASVLAHIQAPLRALFAPQSEVLDMPSERKWSGKFCS